MWYKLNQILGTVLLIGLIGAGAIYGVMVYVETPPLLRQEGDGPSEYELQARAKLQKQLNEIQDQQAAAFERAEDVRQQVLSQ